jgi:hypothetical protein
MIECHLIRTILGQDVPQFGVFLIEGKPRFLTLELPYRNNEHEISCIPEGEYKCKRVFNRVTAGGTSLGTTFEVSNVIGRSGILFHVGNTSKDTKGCILIGQTLEDSDAIRGSKMAFANFLESFSGINEFRLTIKRALNWV